MIKPHRPLTAAEQEIARALFAAIGANPAKAYALVRELVVFRAELPTIRKQRRCLPANAKKALDALPYHHAPAVEFAHD